MHGDAQANHAGRGPQKDLIQPRPAKPLCVRGVDDVSVAWLAANRWDEPHKPGTFSPNRCKNRRVKSGDSAAAFPFESWIMNVPKHITAAGIPPIRMIPTVGLDVCGEVAGDEQSCHVAQERVASF